MIAAFEQIVQFVGFVIDEVRRRVIILLPQQIMVLVSTTTLATAIALERVRGHGCSEELFRAILADLSQRMVYCFLL